MLYLAVKANEKRLRSFVNSVIGPFDIALSKEASAFSALTFSFLASLCDYFQYDCFILPIIICHRIRNHAEVQP